MNVDDFYGDISIPLESFETIFRFLDLPSCYSISLTCKFFNFLNNTPYVWEERAKSIKKSYEQVIEKGFCPTDLELQSLLEPNVIFSTSTKPFVPKVTCQILSTCLIVCPSFMNEARMRNIEEVDELLMHCDDEGTSLTSPRLFTSLEEALGSVRPGGYIYIIRGNYIVDAEITKPVHIIGNMVKNGPMNNTLNSSISGQITYRCKERSTFNHLSLQSEDGILSIEADSNLSFKRVIVCNGFNVKLGEDAKLDIFRCNFISAGKVTFDEKVGHLMCLASNVENFNLELYQYIILQTRRILETGDANDAITADTLVAFLTSIGMNKERMSEEEGKMKTVKTSSIFNHQ